MLLNNLLTFTGHKKQAKPKIVRTPLCTCICI